MKGILIFVLLLSALGSSRAMATSCTDRGFAEVFRSSDVIFEGRLAARETGSESTENGQTFTTEALTFNITRAIKGTAERQVTIRQALNGQHHTVGNDEHHRIFAYRSVRGLSFASCAMISDGRNLSDTRSPEQQAADLREFYQEHDQEFSQEDEAWVAEHIRRRDRRAKRADQFITDHLNRKAQIGTSRNERHLSRLHSLAEYFRDWRDMQGLYETGRALEDMLPDDSAGPAMAGEALYEMRQYSEAIPELEKALALSPATAHVASLLARARLVAEGRFTEGQSDYRDLKAEKLAMDGLVAEQVDLSGSHLAELSVNGAVLSGARFEKVTIRSSDFRNADLSRASFLLGHVRGRFDGANLQHIQATGTDFEQSSFRDADLTGARLRDLRAGGSDFTGASLAHTDLAGSNFRHVLLFRTDLSGADMRGTDFTGARFDCGTRFPEGFRPLDAGMIPVERTCGGVRQD